MFRQIRPAEIGNPIWRETSLAGRTTVAESAFTNTNMRYIRTTDGVQSAGYDIQIPSIANGGGAGLYRETQIIYKFYQAVNNGDFVYSGINYAYAQDTNSFGGIVGRMLLETWFLAADFDPTLLTWASPPAPDILNGDLRFFTSLHANSTGIGADILRQSQNPIYKINGTAQKYYGMFQRLVLKNGTINAAPWNGAAAGNMGRIILLTKKPRLSCPVLQRSSAGTFLRTLTLGPGHPIRYGMQIELAGVDNPATTPKRYNTVTNSGGAVQKQVDVTYHDATTIKYHSLEGNYTEGTTNAPAGAVVKYN